MSCVVVTIGDHCIKTQVASQTVPALSSGEAEFLANVKGGRREPIVGHPVHGQGLRRRAEDAPEDGQHRVEGNRDAHRARQGEAPGHGPAVAIQYHINRGQLSIIKVKGTENLAHLGTKDVEEAIMRRVLETLGFREMAGRHEKSLAVADGLSGYDNELGDPESDEVEPG